MKRLLTAAALAALLAAPGGRCRIRRAANIVRFSDVGWTDITTTTSVNQHAPRTLGYEIDVRSCRFRLCLPRSRKRRHRRLPRELDAGDGGRPRASISTTSPSRCSATNLEGAKYTLVVPPDPT